MGIFFATSSYFTDKVIIQTDFITIKISKKSHKKRYQLIHLLDGLSFFSSRKLPQARNFARYRISTQYIKTKFINIVITNFCQDYPYSDI